MTSLECLDEAVRALRSSNTYDEQPRTIASIETHFAWVFLVNGLVYKLKKPILERFVDLTTLAARQASCAEELRLNRRVSPEIYLGTVALMRRADGTLHVGGDGTPVDWLVKMRRLPSERMLDRLITEHAVVAADLTALGRFLAAFYNRQAPIEISPAAYIEHLRSLLSQDRADLLAVDLALEPARIETVFAAQAAALEHYHDRLAARAQGGYIRETHGDLRPEHICLSDPPSIIDSLEFPAALRTLDVAEELAFLQVECAQAGDAHAGELIVQGYREASGDDFPEALFAFYCSRRAMVRAKIVAWHLREPQVRNRDAWRHRSYDYLERAIEHAAQAVGRA